MNTAKIYSRTIKFLLNKIFNKFLLFPWIFCEMLLIYPAYGIYNKRLCVERSSTNVCDFQCDKHDYGSLLFARWTADQLDGAIPAVEAFHLGLIFLSIGADLISPRAGAFIGWVRGVGRPPAIPRQAMLAAFDSASALPLCSLQNGGAACPASCSPGSDGDSNGTGSAPE